MLRRRAGGRRARRGLALLDFRVAHMAQRAGIGIGIGIEHVAYRGEAQATSDCITGQVERWSSPWSRVLLPFLRDGAWRAIGVTGAARHPVLPETQSFQEGGVAGLDSGTRHGLSHRPARRARSCFAGIGGRRPLRRTRLLPHGSGPGATGRKAPRPSSWSSSSGVRPRIRADRS